MPCLWSLVLYVMFCTRAETLIPDHAPLDTTQPIVRISPGLKFGSDRFGFSLCLYQLDTTDVKSWRIVVGAPTGTYPGGLYLNNPSCTGTPPQRNGLVYLCSIQPGKEICDGAVGNGTKNNGRLFDCIGESTSPNPQMGASLYSYGGYLLACAPTWTIGSLSQASFKGVCYMSFNNSLRTFSKITPCGPKGPNSLSYYDDMFCFAGVNLAVKDKTAIFGAPFAFTTGMATYAQLDKVLTPMAPIAYRGNDTTSGGIVYGSTSMNINGGLVYRTNTLKDYLVATPRWNIDNYVGSVEVFAFPNNGTPLAGPSPPLGNSWSFGAANAEALYNDSIGVYNSVMNVTASGTQTGEQFGSSMDTADLDGDGYDELIVGAPYYSDYASLKFEIGRVYVFLNTKGGLSSTPLILSSTSPTNGGRFGHVVLSVGDINGDETEDFAVGAPYETCTSPADNTVSTGSVYLYSGDRTNPATMTQKITACDVRQASLSALNGSTLRSFGYSLASKADVDGNAYNDLAIGAFESQAIFLLRTFSVANVTVSVTDIGSGVVVTRAGCNSSYPCGSLLLCATYSCRSGSCSQRLSLPFTLTEIPYLDKRRIFFSTSQDLFASVVINATIQQQNCANVTFYAEAYPTIFDVTTPFQIVAAVQSLPRTLSTDSNVTLADFRAIPIFNSSRAIANISISRWCAKPLACQSDLTLNLTTVTYWDAFHNARLSLTPGETSQVELIFLVANSGDEVTGPSLTVAGMPEYVTAVTFLMQNGQPADCTYLSIRTAYVCGPIVGKYILHNESMVVKVILTVNTNAIGYISHNVTFNISSQDASIAGKNNTIVITLDPVVSAILDVVSLSFSPSQRYYKSHLTTANPTQLDAIGYLTTLGVDLHKSGPTAIPNMTLSLSFPRGGADWSSCYLYPASVALVPPSANLTCIPGVVDSHALVTTKSRGVDVMVDTHKLVRSVRQTEGESLTDGESSALQTSTLSYSIDCSQLPLSAECVNLVCYISDIASTSTDFSLQIILYVNDKYFSAHGGQYNLTASVKASIPNIAFDGVIKQAVAKGMLSLVPLPVTIKPVSVHVIIWPIAGVVIIIVVGIILLYSLGFFDRKHQGPAEDEDDLEGEDDADPSKR